MNPDTTPTPRTDAKSVDHIGFYSCATVPSDFAKQLERDLISSVKLLAELNTLRMTEDRSLSEDQWLEYCRLYREYSK
jgi:hypothetical protein